MTQRPTAFGEAPGKVIITGEHFVVHGALALAIALDKTVKVGARIIESNHEVISKTFGSQFKIRGLEAKRNFPALKTIERTLSFLGSNEKVSITIESEIPNASGLGSSSAVAVATVAAIMRLHGKDIDRQVLFDLAMEGEMVIHGNPSGVDVAVAIYGGAILFKRGATPKILEADPHLEIVVGVSGIRRKTSRMIEMFARVRGETPHFFEAMVRSSDSFTGIAAKAIVSGNVELLGAVMNFYNSVLSYFGLGTNDTDKMVDICLSQGAVGAKITGGGGGGSIIALAPPRIGNKVVEALRESGLEAFLLKVPQLGVRSWEEK